MNYFEFYDLPIQFELEAGMLRQLFLKKSKQYHPDFYTLESEEKQAEILELSTLNNEAYKTLHDFDKRLQYILQIKGLLTDAQSNSLPQSFLMEMMEFNEQIMELQFDYNPILHEQLKKNLAQEKNKLQGAIHPLLKHYDDQTAKEGDLLVIRDFYYKNQYLKRLATNLDEIK